MLIDKEKFQENFKHFDNELIVEIIDMFINERDERLKTIKQNIDDKDMDALKFNAHSIKGVIANFMADVPRDHAKALEFKGKENDTDGLDELFAKLDKSTLELAENLKEIRIIYDK